ncbi:MAG: adenylate/guanylate cyclase domain-containing protein [Anaerolineales bacterium]|nr:adenylate/guanylate cyclase domain-containing protein [Anaerolineales bacterium]
MANDYHYKWEWDLKASPEALWPLVSDTNRFNRDTGLPPMQLLGFENGVKQVKFKVPIVNLTWDEEPFEWTYPYRFGILRRYRTGPVAEMRVDCRLENREPLGTHLVYEVWAKGRNLLGDIAIPLVIGIYSAQRFESVFRQYDRIASNPDPKPASTSRPILRSNRNIRYQLLSERLHASGVDEKAVERLGEYLQDADDLSIQRMRPYALADSWGLPRRTVLETFLHATREGILDMYWDLLCPECRGVAEDRKKLGEVHSHSHCNTCQIDFEVNFDRNVEVIFRPNPSIREVDASVEFCVGSPQRQPHIIFSLIVPAHEELPFSTVLDEGRYRLSASSLEGSQNLTAVGGEAAGMDFHADKMGWGSEFLKIGLSPRIRLFNDTDFTQTFQLERVTWSDQAATAADVTTLQVFRDLFSNEVLRVGEEISVGSMTLMFTDLRNSTKMYREIGDAPAFGKVREHFDILEQAVAKEDGSIVKTMGDAVMAAFRNPGSAVRAIWNVQSELAARGVPLLTIKVGIHHGPCIVVNLNERLDYFGSTVNIAARMPHFSSGGELILSSEIRYDPDVTSFLEKTAAPNSVSRFLGDIRGYDTSMELWRVKI